MSVTKPPRLGIGQEMICYGEAARFLGVLAMGSAYRAMPSEQRVGFRRAMQELRHQRNTLAEKLRRHGVPLPTGRAA